MDDHVETLRRYNRWRRGQDCEEMQDPRVVGDAIDAACDKIDRLRADLAERDRTVNRLTEAILHHKESVFGLHTLNVQACDRKLYAEIEQPLKGKGEK